MTKDEILQARFQSFISNLSIEVDDPALGALVIVQWNNSTSSAVTMVPLPKPNMLDIVNAMARALSNSIDRLRAKINQSSDAQKA